MAIDTRGETADKPSGEKKAKRTSPALFYRQIIAELRKVIWPTRKELISYTIIVLVFVVIMIGIVSVLDYVFTEGVLRIFGGA
ncbi:preprotein translocase subunit SecE [Streptosporangium subroseum]|uniref:Protein translocase subunit SecE n=1 Tax=Streptosporangium subroseum TaxID=106412 RepID=A0A239L819_9ACTN|nr:MULTISPECIES: preprotein translocase subunit SecE [Streptosporangium]AWS48152.1 preprotein translocase subunit SecE [Streptosporangium sp. 'caverna']WSA16181.1 preprotein translocase subunit SecE [Streptosporangium subroseum]SNT26756.1 preprotein translocase subunit SecE [Streptosporangium subroseum]